jgi:hypothetical protein
MSVFRPTPAKVDDKVALQRHLNQTDIVIRKLETGGAAANAVTDHTIASWADTKAALDALGVLFNAHNAKLS